MKNAATNTFERHILLIGEKLAPTLRFDFEEPANILALENMRIRLGLQGKICGTKVVIFNCHS